MGKTFAEGKDEIVNLCRCFSINHDAFLAPGVKEADIRQSLIDPLFEALGWDVRNTAQVAPQYREVIPEKSLEVEGQQKSPDYTFRVGTLPKFYVEPRNSAPTSAGTLVRPFSFAATAGAPRLRYPF
jgi:predicted type IV restriction endonuclease